MTETDRVRYLAALHAVQSGVAAEIAHDISHDTDPKMLRVGVNAAMSDHAGLAKLLMEKGIFSEDEYLCAIADQMEIEKLNYEKGLSELLGKPIGLA